MSLINDALKNAAKASTPAGPNEGKDSVEPMRAAVSHPSAGLPPYFFPVLLCVFCGAIWFIARGWEARRQTDSASGPALSVQARETHSVAAGTGAVDGAGERGHTESAADALFPLPDENAPIPAQRDFSINDSPAASGRDRPVASVPSGPRLQGIFYRASGPSAVIDAETVFVGDTVAGGRVKAIDRTSVTLERDGQTQVLTLRR